MQVRWVNSLDHDPRTHYSRRKRSSKLPYPGIRCSRRRQGRVALAGLSTAPVLWSDFRMKSAKLRRNGPSRTLAAWREVAPGRSACYVVERQSEEVVYLVHDRSGLHKQGSDLELCERQSKLRARQRRRRYVGHPIQGREIDADRDAAESDHVSGRQRCGEELLESAAV